MSDNLPSYILKTKSKLLTRNPRWDLSSLRIGPEKSPSSLPLGRKFKKFL